SLAWRMYSSLRSCCSRTHTREFIHRGKSHRECCSRPSRIVGAKNLAAVLLHNPITDTQAQARTLSDLLGGEKWVENSFRLRNTAAVVTEQHLHKIILSRT